MKLAITQAIILLGLAIGCHSQGAPQAAGGEAAPEPYSYSYETDTHAASEQRDPSGTVQGFYTLSGPDGRARRVEYTADETGFHARVVTNEMGTRSSAPADVQVVAEPPTPDQVRQASVVGQPQRVAATVAPQQAAVATTGQVGRAPTVASGYFQNQAYNGNYGYYPGYYPGYGYGNGYGAGYGYRGYGYAPIAPGYGYGAYGAYGGYGAGYQYPGYYRGGAYGVPRAYAAGQTVGAQQAAGQRVGYQTVATPRANVAGAQGSSNYIVLKK